MPGTGSTRVRLLVLAGLVLFGCVPAAGSAARVKPPAAVWYRITVHVDATSVLTKYQIDVFHRRRQITTDVADQWDVKSSPVFFGRDANGDWHFATRDGAGSSTLRGSGTHTYTYTGYQETGAIAGQTSPTPECITHAHSHYSGLVEGAVTAGPVAGAHLALTITDVSAPAGTETALIDDAHSCPVPVTLNPDGSPVYRTEDWAGSRTICGSGCFTLEGQSAGGLDLKLGPNAAKRINDGAAEVTADWKSETSLDRGSPSTDLTAQWQRGKAVTVGKVTLTRCSSPASCGG